MSKIAPLILAGLAVTLLVEGCGPKRPPEVATAKGAAGAPEGGDTASARSEAPSSTLDTGRDVVPVDRAGAPGEDIPGTTDFTREGGPLEDIYFEFDHYALTDAARATLDKHAAWLKDRPTLKVAIEGHCDERGTTEYNLALGDKRARATREYLVSKGIAEGRLSAVSLGKERPVDAGHDEAAWSKNRRAHFAVSR